MCTLKDIIWSDQEYDLKEFYETFSEDLPQIVLVTSGVYGINDMETFGAEERMHISTYARQTRVIAMDPTNCYMSIPITYPVRMEIVESPGKYSRPFTLQEIIDSKVLPVRVRFVKDGSKFRHASDASSYNMMELELQDTYKETYFLGNGFYHGKLIPPLMVMPIYLEIKMVVAVGWTFGEREEWPNFLEELKESAKETDFNVPTVNADIAMYEPGQVNVGENIYEYIRPQNYLTLSKAPGEVFLEGDYSEPPPTAPRAPHTVAKPQKFGENQYVTLKPNPKFKKNKDAVTSPKVKNASPAPPPPRKKSQSDSSGPPVPLKSPGYANCSSVKFRHLPPPPPMETPNTADKPTFKQRTVKVSPPENPTKSVAVSGPTTKSQIPAKTEVSSAISGSRIHTLSDIPDNISSLTVNEVADCLRLLNLGEYAEASKRLLIDGFLLKEFSAEDFQNDENFQMSIAQSKMLVRFAQDGWRPRRN